MQKDLSSSRKELSIIAENGTDSDKGKPNRKKRKIFQNCRVKNVREVAHLTETLKQELKAKAQKIECRLNKIYKERNKRFYRNLSMKYIEASEPPSMAEAEMYWKLLWGEEAQHNERAEWIRREQKRKVSYMGGMLIHIMEITSYLSKAHNSKSIGSDPIQNYWNKAFPATHRHIT